jgi:hypothetical protein
MPQSSNKTQVRALVRRMWEACLDDIVMCRRCANVGQRVGWAAPGHWWLTL